MTYQSDDTKGDRRRQPSREPRALRLLLDEVAARRPLSARAQALELLQHVPLDAPRKDLVAQVLYRQRTTDGIVATLTALADLLESGLSRSAALPPARLTHLPVWPDPHARYHVAIIPAIDLVYAFTAAAITQGFLSVDWRLQASPREQRVYLRVDRSRQRDPQGVGVLATPYRTLKDLVALLDPARFHWANQSIVVNRQYVRDFEVRSPIILWVGLTDGRMESIHVSGEHWRTLRRVFRLTVGMCRRTSGAGAGR